MMEFHFLNRVTWLVIGLALAAALAAAFIRT
jgi:hypothetical protein